MSNLYTQSIIITVMEIYSALQIINNHNNNIYHNSFWQINCNSLWPSSNYFSYNIFPTGMKMKYTKPNLLTERVALFACVYLRQTQLFAVEVKAQASVNQQICWDRAASCRISMWPQQVMCSGVVVPGRCDSHCSIQGPFAVISVCKT